LKYRRALFGFYLAAPEFSRSAEQKPLANLLQISYNYQYVLRYIHRWRCSMNAVTVSPKYQVVIPRSVRESLGIKPGQKVQVVQYENRVELIPMKPIKQTRGFLKGIKTQIPRERDRL